MRAAEEIERAHETLRLAIAQPVVAGVDLRICIAVQSALCWVLGHGANGEFLENLAGLEETLLACGARNHEKSR